MGISNWFDWKTTKSGSAWFGTSRLSSSSEAKKFVENENIALLTPEDKRIFETSKIGDQDALFDTEAKLLENIAQKLGDKYDGKGIVDLYTQLSPCASCRGVISQFMDRYPYIKINLYYDKQYHN